MLQWSDNVVQYQNSDKDKSSYCKALLQPSSYVDAFVHTALGANMGQPVCGYCVNLLLFNFITLLSFCYDVTALYFLLLFCAASAKTEDFPRVTAPNAAPRSAREGPGHQPAQPGWDQVTNPLTRSPRATDHGRAAAPHHARVPAEGTRGKHRNSDSRMAAWCGCSSSACRPQGCSPASG